ncbi:hypothetical protein HIM_11243 [Hirsutella minnesotensis 3608]|uniref:Uncharacterized protein n=1 Tax=Hirsutella minnesotensis 3608 TaxID=1043627 RepID=A0A0F7ZFL7_9HYPO|nr:hypothetical protein HIM_11243 [Hirsutella minnesotensis 3608]
MASTSFQTLRRRIQAEKSLKYVGTARIRLDVLTFPHSSGLNPDNVQRLAALFRGQRGYNSEDLQHRIPAIISDANLREALAASGLGQDSLSSSDQDAPMLEFPSGFQLECLRGQHRVKAAEEIINTSNKRWTVDLFTADISDDAKRDLIEEYASERKTDDEEFYYKIREYQGIFGQENQYFESRWWARLTSVSGSTNKKQRLEQLFGHRKFAHAFDEFRHLPALYYGLRLSVVNKMISMRCDEELLLFLTQMKELWYRVFDGDETAMGKLDRATVEALQLTAPGACDAEAQLPSLYAFFENIKYLRVAADCIKRLLRLESKETIRCAFENAFCEEGNECLIQTSNNTFKAVPADTADQFDTTYRQLWLCAFREYRDMPSEPKKKLAGPKSGQVDESVLFGFASLARRLGYSTKEIDSLLQRDPDREMARRLLTTASAISLRPTLHFRG